MSKKLGRPSSGLSKKELRRIQLYGLHPAKFDTLYLVQCGRCAICKRHLFKNEVHIDHDHLTNKVRGLLCGGCNIGLGHFKDDPSFLRNAAKYVETNSGRV